MDTKRAISILNSGTDTPAVSYTKDEWAEACQMACEALRQSLQTTYSLDSAIADHYRNIGLSMERMEELATADKAGRLVILPDTACTDKDGEEALRKAMWVCNNTNNGVTRYAADAIAEKLCRDAQKASAKMVTIDEAIEMITLGVSGYIVLSDIKYDMKKVEEYNEALRMAVSSLRN